MNILIKRILLLVIICSPWNWVSGQDYDSVRLSQLPVLQAPSRHKTSALPYKTDNSRTKYFPAIFTQYGSSCGQAASIAVGFTYELNVMRDRDAGQDENRLPAFFTWNMMNSGNFERGVSYFESWDMVEAIGCPSWSDFGYSNNNETKWMSGYYRYYRGMKNRVREVYSIDVSKPEGLDVLKHWLYDHLGEYRPGGVASFQIATLDLQFVPLPEGTEEAGKMMIPSFNYAVGHAMTFVGYNDSVRYDFNNDGRYTNDTDTNGDGEVNMADWEIGALICVNTYGLEWGSEGRAFVPYRILPLDPYQGGIWMKSVVVAKPHDLYEPALTLKTQVRYPDRSKLWITAGVSADPSALQPDHILDQPVFHFQGGSLPMQGRGPVDPGLIEIGIDATSLLGYVESGKPAAFFMVVSERDPQSLSEGTVSYFSLNEYAPEETEHPGSQVNIPISKNYQSFPVVFTPVFDGPGFSGDQLPGAVAGQAFHEQLAASGGTPPYQWKLLDNRYQQTRFEEPFPMTFQNKILPVGDNAGNRSVDLPFGFPFKGKVYNQITLSASGGILFEEYSFHIPWGFDLRELLGLNVAIYPFYSTEFSYTDPLDGVYFLAHTTGATVYWNASLRNNGEVTDVNFAARLYPDGVIEFYYGKFDNKITTPWLIGLTGGSREKSYYPDINAIGISEDLNIRFEPPVLPEDLMITPEGRMTCRPWEPGKTWLIPVGVTDDKGLTSLGELKLSTAPLDAGSKNLPTAEISIYPNPVTDRAFIQIESILTGEIQVSVHDVTGKELINKSYAVKPGRSTFMLDLSSKLTPGLYLIHVSGICTLNTRILFIGKAG